MSDDAPPTKPEAGLRPEEVPTPEPESLEAPRIRQPRTPKQLESLAAARAAKATKRAKKLEEEKAKDDSGA